jgi:hypothetical protein
MTIQKIEIKQRCYTMSGPEILRATIQNPGEQTGFEQKPHTLSPTITLDIFVGGETHRVVVTPKVSQPDNKEMSLVEWHKV